MRSSSCFGVVGDVLVGHPDAAAVGLEEAHDLMQRHRLAHAAAAQDAHGLAGHNVEADAIEHDIAAERLVDVLELDVGLALALHRRYVWDYDRQFAYSSGVLMF